MAIYALVSPGGSPGVTTTALALTLAWPRPVILAECDPAGGDILAGLFAGHLAAHRGLLGVALEAGAGPAAVAAELAGQLAPLDDGGERRFLAGISDPRQARGVAPSWPLIATALAGLNADVIADCGRLDAGECQPVSVLAQAAFVAMVLRPSLRQIAAARPRIELAAGILGGPGRLGALLVGDGGHSAAEIAGTLGVPVIDSLPHDPKTAAVLSDGEGRRTGLSRRPLMRAARIAGLTLIRAGQPAARPVAATAAGGAR